jgi:hypothetical protein
MKNIFKIEKNDFSGIYSFFELDWGKRYKTDSAKGAFLAEGNPMIFMPLFVQSLQVLNK